MLGAIVLKNSRPGNQWPDRLFIPLANVCMNSAISNRSAQKRRFVSALFRRIIGNPYEFDDVPVGLHDLILRIPRFELQVNRHNDS